MKCIKNIRQKQKTTKNPGKGVLKGFKQVWYQPFLCAAVVFGLPGGATPLSTEFCIDISALPYRRWARRLKCAQNSPLAQTRMPSCKTRMPSCAEFKSPRSNPSNATFTLLNQLAGFKVAISVKSLSSLSGVYQSPFGM